MARSRFEAMLACAAVSAGFLAVFLAAACAPLPDPLPAPPPPQSSSRVEDLLAQMTLEEKLGQLNMIQGGRSRALNSLLDEEGLERVRRGEVGSFLHVAGAERLGEVQRVAVEESRLGIPLLFAMDVVHGYRTIFPVPIALAGSFDPGAAELAARVSAVEATSAGLHWTFAPMVDIAPDPRWGRIVEGAGEDPYLASVMAAAWVRGYQGQSLGAPDTMLATVKHFAAYGAALGGRDYASAEISYRALEEYYLPPFHAAHRAGAATMMTAFNDIGGVPVTANRGLVRNLLRGDWGFDGVVVSDWNAIAELINHGVAADRGEAGLLALDASVDVDMTSRVYIEDLRARVENVPEAITLIDQAVRRVLHAKEQLGLFDNPYQYHDPEREAATLMSDRHRAIAREIAVRSMVLLKNEGGLLPLARDRRIAVIGALADDASSPLGSWRARGQVEDSVSLLAGLRAELGSSARITYTPGAAPDSDDEGGIVAAVRAARASDVVLLVVGENFDQSGESRSRSSLELPGAQEALARAVIATGKPVVAVLMNGRPLAIPFLAENSEAILETWFAGVEAGPAIADVLFGDAAPAGRLPAAFPRTTGQVPFSYLEPPSGRPADPDLARDTTRYHDLPITPLYPFGHGLSYTSFEYSDLAFSAPRMEAAGEIEVSVRVRNSGSRAGDEVVQLYMRDPVASVARPVSQLRGFHRLHLEPGEARTVTFKLSAGQFALYAQSGRWVVEPGRIDIMVGASSADIRLRGSFDIIGAPLDAFAPAAALQTEVRVQ
jgi:beta-glucosidase